MFSSLVAVIWPCKLSTISTHGIVYVPSTPLPSLPSLLLFKEDMVGCFGCFVLSERIHTTRTNGDEEMGNWLTMFTWRMQLANDVDLKDGH